MISLPPANQLTDGDYLAILIVIVLAAIVTETYLSEQDRDKFDQ